VDLEAAKAKLECQREDFARQQVVQPLGNNDDTHTGAPSTLRFPHVAYNMAAAACSLEDISDTPDPKTNERLHEAKRLLRIALEQQVESSASHRRVAYSQPSQQTATVNGDRSNAHALLMGGNDGDSSINSSDQPRI
jgi:predicted negative regulator of RcsB-dependent stress response